MSKYLNELDSTEKHRDRKLFKKDQKWKLKRKHLPFYKDCVGVLNFDD
jgi:hypothetical protein